MVAYDVNQYGYPADIEYTPIDHMPVIYIFPAYDSKHKKMLSQITVLNLQRFLELHGRHDVAKKMKQYREHDEL